MRQLLQLPVVAVAAGSEISLGLSPEESCRIGTRGKKRQQQGVGDQVRGAVKLTTVSWVVEMTLEFDSLEHERRYYRHLLSKLCLGRECRAEEREEIAEVEEGGHPHRQHLSEEIEELRLEEGEWS
jgi:hypothetical protein